MPIESDFQTKFSRWAKHNLHHSCACELKLVKGTSMPFSAIADHQYLSLRLAKHGTLVYKLSDFSLGAKPFDTVILSGVPAYLVVMFYVARGTKEFYLIDIDTLDRFQTCPTRKNEKSLTLDEARSIADMTGVLA